jgi:pimeloyl-ACP methyl ester carboxylesterase
VPDTVEAARANPDSIADRGIDDVTSHYAAIIAGLPAKPVLIGHSFGGMIAEKLLGQDLAAGAIAIDAAQIKGVLPLPLSSLRSTLPVFRNPANKHLAVSLTPEQFRYSFGNAIDPGESDSLYEQWTIQARGIEAGKRRRALQAVADPGEVLPVGVHHALVVVVVGGVVAERVDGRGPALRGGRGDVEARAGEGAVRLGELLGPEHANYTPTETASWCLRCAEVTPVECRCTSPGCGRPGTDPQ